MSTQNLPVIPGFTVTAPLATGGMAEVFRAVQASLGREVAIKVMKQGDAALAERFQLEARLVATLNHAHIVTIHDVGVLEDGRPYLAMELLSGGDLAGRIRRGLRDEEIRRVVREVAEGLEVVHAAGIVHRDLKPANILFRENGDAVISDFGIAKATLMDTELTQAGMVIGSPAYSSPEQVSAKPVDARSDLYSLGVVLAEMLLGYNPFRTQDYGSTVVNQLQMAPPELSESQRHWQPLLDRLLAKEPERRPASARDVIEAVDALGMAAVHGDMDATLIKTALHVAVVPAAVQADAGRRFSRRTLVAVALVLLLAGFGWRLWQQHRQVQAWLVLAEQRLSQDKLSTPETDSAVFYFQRVLEQDDGNERARSGLAKVVARYGELARLAWDEGDSDKALELLARGLALQPGDAALKQLQEDIREELRRNGSRPHEQKGGLKGFLHNLFGS